MQPLPPTKRKKKENKKNQTNKQANDIHLIFG